MKLSVSVVTFQEIDFIRQSLESVLQQQTNFPFEVIVGDDASTDGTQDILREIAAQYPDKVTLLIAPENYGDYGLSNFMSTIDNCRGEYLAFLDGDDYFSCADKLQRQVDFLDAHPECNMCAHRLVHLHDDGRRELSTLPASCEGNDSGIVETVHEIGEYLFENFSPKAATVVRRSAIDDLPDWYRTTRIASADWVFNVLASRAGKIGYINDVMAVHRKRDGGLTAFYGARRMLSDKLIALETLKEYFPDHQKEVVAATRRVRWKLRVSRLGPLVYKYVRRVNKTKA